MPAWDLGIRVRSLQSYVMALAIVLLASCSLIESPKEGTEIRSPLPTQTGSVNIVSEGNYMESCRAKGVPIPPGWEQSSSE